MLGGVLKTARERQVRRPSNLQDIRIQPVTVRNQRQKANEKARCAYLCQSQHQPRPLFLPTPPADLPQTQPFKWNRLARSIPVHIQSLNQPDERGRLEETAARGSSKVVLRRSRPSS